MATKNRNQSPSLWYKDAIIYELHVRAFRDSNRDGYGDFRGLIEKLDYLSDLGITAIWLLPFYPSPLKDDGYDIADYFDIHPMYGTLDDFKLFLQEAHKRDIKVITELAINHTSDQHEWFQKSRRARKGTYWRNFYVWSDHESKYSDARIIFKDFENSNWTWDREAKAYYWHRFYAHQPDLNFDNPEVQKAIFRIVDFWMGMGVDGMRLDAIPYLFEREGTSCENLPETHAFIKSLRAHVDKHFQDRLLLAEANQWPEDAVAYFGNGDECHMCYHFPLMPRLFMALKLEDRYSICDILAQTPPIPENAQWATFLRNHDELTLEMVTDEERDYMYSMYAKDNQARINLGIRRRLASLLGYDRRQIELLNMLLFALPGTPVLYYGDEIGMGDNHFLSDRDGVRTPFQWSPDRNAGFSEADPQRLYLPVVISPECHYETINAENQIKSPYSLLWWTKKMISLRKSNPIFGRGSIEFVFPNNRKVLVFTRRWNDQAVLCVANLSNTIQHTELDLSEFKGFTPVEMNDRVVFPIITDQPYFLNLSPHFMYIFEIRKQETLAPSQKLLSESEGIVFPRLPLEQLFLANNRKALEYGLKNYLPKARWFMSKSRQISKVELLDHILLDTSGTDNRGSILIIEVRFTEGASEIYAQPINFAEGERMQKILEEAPKLVLLELRSKKGEPPHGILYDSMIDAPFSLSLVECLANETGAKGYYGKLVPELHKHSLKKATLVTPKLTSFEQSNSSVLFPGQYFLKLYRKLEEGIHPEPELGVYLEKSKKFNNAPSVAGTWYYQTKGRKFALGILQEFIQSETEAWQMFGTLMSRFVDDTKSDPNPLFQQNTSVLDLLGKNPFASLNDRFAHLPMMARQLGQRTAEMHLAFGHAKTDPHFTPEPFTPFYQRSLFQSFRNLSQNVKFKIESNLAKQNEATQVLAKRFIEQLPELLKRLDYIKTSKDNGMRIRIHGDFHLGQVLHTGKDFLFVDFEGEPARSMAERRAKRSPLRDVAGMLRSFGYVAEFYIKQHPEIDPEGANAQWARCGAQWLALEYLESYLKTMGKTTLLPAATKNRVELLRAYTIEKALYEVNYEIENRPDWLTIPLRGIHELAG